MQLQHGGDVEEAENLLRAVVVLRQDTVGKCSDDRREVIDTAADQDAEVLQLLLLAVSENRQRFQATEGRQHRVDAGHEAVVVGANVLL